LNLNIVLKKLCDGILPDCPNIFYKESVNISDFAIQGDITQMFI